MTMLRRRADVRTFLVVSFLLAGLLAAALPALADPQSKLDRLRDKQADAAAKAEKFEGQSDKVLARIKVLDAKRARVETKVEALDEQLDALDGRIHIVKERLYDAQQKVALLTDDLQGVLTDLEDRTDLFTERAIAAYKAGPGAYVDTVLSSSSFTDLDSQLVYWEAAADWDSDLISEIEVLRGATEIRRSEILEKQEEIILNKRTLEEDRKEVAVLRAEHAAVLAKKEAFLAEKESLLDRVNKKKAYWEALENQLAQDAARVENLLSTGSTGSAFGNGQLMWPADGPMTSPYGWRTHPIFGDQRLHTGIDISAGYGSSVWAADTGEVTFVGVMSGYGNVIIIDHGNGLATTYNHLSAQYVGTGTIVQRGTTIGAVGCTGYCTGPHLHFEVRINGGPVDPMPYLQ